MTPDEIVEQVLTWLEDPKNCKNVGVATERRLDKLFEEIWQKIEHDLEIFQNSKAKIDFLNSIQTKFKYFCSIRNISLEERDVTGYGGCLTRAGKFDSRLEKTISILIGMENITPHRSSPIVNPTSTETPEKAGKNLPKLRWLGTEGAIVYLYAKLVEQGFILSGDNMHEFVERNFVNRGGKPFKKEQLKVVKQRLLDSQPRRAKELDKIVTDTKVVR